eukprot:274941_1
MHETNHDLPLGHPQRIRFRDTMSGAFKDKVQERSVQHRSWAVPKKCRDCGTTYPCADDYYNHRMVYHSEGIEIEHKCSICDKIYRELRYMNRHYRNSHFPCVCKIDGHGDDREGLSNAQLKKLKGIDSICGYRFLDEDDLSAHQAIIHGIKNEYRNERDGGPTIRFMKGMDVKSVVFEQLTSNDRMEEDDDDDDLDLSDITMALQGNQTKGEIKPKKHKKSKKSTKKKNKKRKRGKSPKKSKKKKTQSPPPKKQKVNRNTTGM